MAQLSRQEKLDLINELEVQHVGHDRNEVPYVLVKTDAKAVEAIRLFASDPENYLYTKGVCVQESSYLEDPLASDYFNIAPLAYKDCDATAFVNGKFV